MAGHVCSWVAIALLLLTAVGIARGQADLESTSDSNPPQATLLILSDLNGFPLGTAGSAVKVRAIFSEQVATLDLRKVAISNATADSFTLKTFDNTSSSLIITQQDSPVMQVTSTNADPSADPSAWRGLLGPVALDFKVRPNYPLGTVNVTFEAGAFADVSGNVNKQAASVSFVYDPTNPIAVEGYPAVTSIGQTSVTLTFSFTKTSFLNYTLYNQQLGYSPGNWTALKNAELELNPQQSENAMNGSLAVVAGKIVDVTVGGLQPNQGYLLLVDAVDQYGNEAQTIPGAALQTRDVPSNAVGSPSLTSSPISTESAKVVLSAGLPGDNPSIRYVITPFNPNSLVPTNTASPSCNASDETSQKAPTNSTLHFSQSVIVSAIACENNGSSRVIEQPLIVQASAPILTLPNGPFLNNATVSLLYNGSLPNTTIKYTFTPAGSPLVPPACPYGGWPGYGRKTSQQSNITLTQSGTLQAVTCSIAGLQSPIVTTGPLYVQASSPSVILPDSLPQAPFMLNLKASTPGSSIQYLYTPLSEGPSVTSSLTCDTPGASFNASDAILWESGVLMALTCKDGLIASDVTVQNLTLAASPPKISPIKGLGTYNVTIVTRTSGALILYTSDPKAPLNCPSSSGGPSAQPVPAPPSGNLSLASDSVVFSGRTKVVFQADATAVWRATACPYEGTSLSPSGEMNATVIVVQIDPSQLPSGQAQVTAEVTVLNANTSIFNDTKAQLRFETAIASAISSSGNVTVSPNNVMVTSIILAGNALPTKATGRSTLERHLLSNATSAKATNTPSPTRKAGNATSASSSKPPVSLALNVTNSTTDNSSSLDVQFTVVTTPLLGAQVRSALALSVQNEMLASALTSAGFQVAGGSPSGSSVLAPASVTNGSDAPASVTSTADGVSLTTAGVQYSDADLQNCVFTFQAGNCSISPINKKQCARLVNYTLVTPPGPAGQACPVGLSTFVTQVQAFEGCPMDQCEAAGSSNGSSLPAGIWVVIALLITGFLVTLVVGLLLYKRRAGGAREQEGAKTVEDTWQKAPTQARPTAGHFQSGGDAGMRRSPMCDTAARAIHSDVGGARAVEDGRIVDFEAYCEAWDRRFMRSPPAGGPTENDTGVDTSAERLLTSADFADKAVDTVKVGIAYADGSPMVDPLEVDSSSSSGLVFFTGPGASPMHEKSHSGPLIGSSPPAYAHERDRAHTGPLLASRVSGFRDDGMEDVVLEMMRIDRDSLAQEGEALARAFALENTQQETVKRHNQEVMNVTQTEPEIPLPSPRRPLTSRDVSPNPMGRSAGLPPKATSNARSRPAGLPRSASPGLIRTSSGELTKKAIQRSMTAAYSGPYTPATAGRQRRSTTPDLVQRPRDSVVRYSQGFLDQRSPLKLRPEANEPGTLRARSKSVEQSRSADKMDDELKNIIVQLKEGMECPDPVVVSFGDSENALQDDSQDLEKQARSAKRSESFGRLGIKRIGAWMKGEPGHVPDSDAREAPVHTEEKDDRTGILANESERSDGQGSKVWAWLRTAGAHSETRSTASEADARASDLSSAELGGAAPREDSNSSSGSFWKKRIFGRSFSTMTLHANSPIKDEAREEQRKLRPSWATVSY